MTAALGPWIMRHPEVKNNMEQFMLQFVTPEFSSSEPYLRAIVSSSAPLTDPFDSIDCFIRFNKGMRGIGHCHQGWDRLVK